LIRWLRNCVKSGVLYVLRRAAQSDEGRGILAESVGGAFRNRPLAVRPDWQTLAPPYADLGEASDVILAGQRSDAVFITARFRSGSTLLWNLFRHLPHCTAYYEPLNERRWFDPRTRGTFVDPTHREVDDYWREYEGLSELGRYYRQRWVHRELYMDADAWDTDMKRYVEILIDRAPGRPVLQFNRIDFRLPWFRHHFPRAKIVHLYRHPREQWCSSLLRPDCFTKDQSIAEFARHDQFYLRMWASDLKCRFPFLDEREASHPYELFYYIWKLSYLLGRTYAHYSLAYEELLTRPEETLVKLFAFLNVVEFNLHALKAIIKPPRADKWRDYADDAWFRKIESRCENVLAQYLTPGPRPALLMTVGDLRPAS